jgi:hypothetical protein
MTKLIKLIWELSLMNRKILWAILFCLIIINKARAERSFLFLGGGGEPERKSNTIFDPTINLLDNYLNLNKWKNDISFNGGHKDSEALLKNKFKSANSKSSFDKKNYNQLLEKYIKDMRSGKLKSGEQLLVFVDTHGAAKGPDESTHRISIGNGNAGADLNNLSGSDTISMDTMKTLVEVAKEKGIKLAILDMSCHSGSTLALANESNCIITSTGPNHYGYAGFSEGFIKNMKAGKSLEDVFLETRKADTSASYPMISSPAGLSINKTIYPNISPYLYYYNDIKKNGKLYDYIIDESSSPSMCLRENQFKKLEATIENFQRIGALGITMQNPRVKRILDLLREYKELQDKLIKSNKGLPMKELDTIVKFSDSVRLGNSELQTKMQYSWRNLLEIDCNQVIESAESEIKKTTDSNKKLELLSEISLHKKIKNKQEEFYAKNPNLRNFKQKMNADLKEMGKSFMLAYRIAEEERKIYDEMYKDQGKTKNSCKDFIL